MARLYTFPEQGWCSNAKKALGKYLAERYNMEYEPPGDNGYAWNSGSYWTIITASGKEKFAYSDLEPLLGKPIDDSDIHIAVKTRKPKEIPEDVYPKFKIGSIVENISDGYPVIPKGWTAKVTGYSPNGARTYAMGFANANKDKNIQFELHTSDLKFVAKDFEAFRKSIDSKKFIKREQEKADRFAEAYGGSGRSVGKTAIQSKWLEDCVLKTDDLRAYPMFPDECYPGTAKDFLEATPKPIRRTKRSKYFLRTSIKGFVKDFIDNPCKEIFLSDEAGHWDTTLGLFDPSRLDHHTYAGFSIGTPTKGRRSAIFDPVPLQTRIKELRRRKLFLKRSRR